MSIKTLGRRPTLGEVLEYYTRDDFLRFLLDTCRTRPVVMVIPKDIHWEPDWKENEITASDAGQLGRYILDKIHGSLPEVGLDDRLSYYPSFHQSIGKRADRVEERVREGDRSSTPGRTGSEDRASVERQDCIFEADLPTWRESFRDVVAIIDRMDRYDVCYYHKFSGHRSLHIVIPAEVLPKGYRGKGSQEAVRRLTVWSGSQAHRLPKITRMPYSLNEDTGLVCLPIERGMLPCFRPWQANIHLVEIRNIWDEPISEDDADHIVREQAKMMAFLDALRALESEGGEAPSDPTGSGANRSSRCVFFFPDREKIASAYRGRLAGVRGSGSVGRAWQRLAVSGDMSEHALMEGLACSDPDAQWITVEAFFLNGARISQEGMLKLLAQDEEYVWPAAADVLLRFDEDLLPYLVQIVEDPARYPAMVAKASYLLTQSDALRERFLDRVVQRSGSSHRALITAACLAGSLAGDWAGALRLSEPVRTSPTLSESDQAGLAALDLMSTMGGWDKTEEAKKSQALAALGGDVAELLLAAAGSPERRFRRGIVAALALLADERAVGVLIRSLGDDYSKVRRKAVAGLVKIGEQAVDPLIEATASDQPSVRKHAVLCLGSIGAQRAKPALLQALDDGEEAVRRQAIRALKKMATVDDIVRLKQALRREAWDNAVLAIDLMEAIGDEGKRAMLEMALQERNPAAAYSIAHHGDPRGREILPSGYRRMMRRGTMRRSSSANWGMNGVFRSWRID